LLGAVGSVAWQQTTVGGDEVIDEVLQLPDAGKGVQEQRESAPDGGGHRRVHRFGASVATAVGRYRPRGLLALFDGEPHRRADVTLLEGHRPHATVAVERVKEAHRPRAEPAGPVEHEGELGGRSVEIINQSVPLSLERRSTGQPTASITTIDLTGGRGRS
jgi:hypothetical protein